MTTFSFSTDAPAEVKAGVLILPVFQGPEFGPGVKETGLQQAYKDAKLTGKKGESLLVTKRNGDRFAAGAVLLQVSGSVGTSTTRRCGRRLAGVAPSVGRFGHAATTFPQAVKGDIGELAQAAAEGLGLGGYRFDRYKSKNEHTPLSKVTIVGNAKGDAKAGRKAVRQRGGRRGCRLVGARPREHARRRPSPGAARARGAGDGEGRGPHVQGLDGGRAEEARVRRHPRCGSGERQPAAADRADLQGRRRLDPDRPHRARASRSTRAVCRSRTRRAWRR